MSRISPDDVVLGLLAANPAHGYQLLEHFRAPHQLGKVWHLSTSQLYAILKRLEQGDYVIGREILSSDAPTRTEYQLAESGRNRLDTWLHDPNPSASTRHIRTEFLSRLYIAHLLRIPVRPIIQRQKAACWEQKSALVAARQQVETGIGALSLDLLVSELDVILQWIDRCEAHLTGHRTAEDAPESTG